MSKGKTGRWTAKQEITWLMPFPQENPNPVLRVEHSGRIIYANPASEPLLLNWNCRVGDDLPPPWRQQLAAAVAGPGRVSMEVRCGERVYTLMIVPIPGADYTNFYGIDITERKRAEESLRQHAERLQMLQRLDGMILAARSAQEMAEAALDHIREFIPCRRVSLVTFDFEANRAIILAVNADRETRLGKGTSLMPEDWPIEELRQGKTYLVRDSQFLSSNPLVLQILHGEDIQAAIYVPLRVRDELIGVLNLGLDSPFPDDFEPGDTLQEIANHLAIGLHQAHLSEQLRRHTVGLERLVYERTLALQESEGRFQRLAEHSLDIIYRYRVRPTPGFEFLSPAITTLSGYTPAEFYADPGLIFKLVHPDDLPLIEALREVDYLSDQPIFLRWIRRDGRLLWTEQRNVAVYDDQGTVLAVEGIARDITERKQAEEELRESRQFTQKIVDTSPYLVYIYDLVERRLVYVNKRILTVAGYSPADVYEQGSNLLKNMIHPDDYPAVIAQHKELAATTSDEVFEQEFRVKCQNVEYRWFRVWKVVFSRDAAGQAQQMLATAEDITERRQIRAEKERLFEEVNRQREQLRALTRQLAQAQETERKELSWELHDRVGSKLTVLNLNLTVLEAQLAETTLPAAGSLQARLADSQALTAEIADHIRDVMAFLRPPVLDDFGLVAALRWYCHQLAPRVAFAITVQGEEPVPRLAPPVENALFRVAQEALTNAAKHAQASAVTLTVRVDEQAVYLIIFDDGVGFEPAHRMDHPEKQGWGLTTMVERVETVGGSCRVNSRLGQGTQIIVEVPR